MFWPLTPPALPLKEKKYLANRERILAAQKTARRRRGTRKGKFVPHIRQKMADVGHPTLLYVRLNCLWGCMKYLSSAGIPRGARNDNLEGLQG